MRRIPLAVLILYFCSGTGSVTAAGLTIMPSPSPSAGASARPSIDGKKLLHEFQKAQYMSISALLHRQKRAASDLKASQTVRDKEWKDREKEARHKFLATSPKGPETRQFMHDYLERLKALDKMMKDERRQLDQENKVRYEAEKQDQIQKLKEFKSYLDKNELPPQNLWPSN